MTVRAIAPISSFKLVAGIIGIGLAALFGFLLFSRAVYRYGLIGGTVIVVGILLLVAAYYDRKHQRDYEDDEAGS